LQLQLDNLKEDLAEEVRVIFPLYGTNATSTNTEGDCTIIQVNGKVLVIDTYDNATNFAQVKATMERLNITKIDMFIITHWHTDHYRNFNSFLTNFDMTECDIILPRVCNNLEFKTECENANSTTVNQIATAGCTYRYAVNETIDFGGAKIKIFNGSQADVDYYDTLAQTQDAVDYNNYSICTQIEFLDKVLLFTGDLSDVGQKYCAKNYINKKANLYKAHHHGDWNHLYERYMSLISPDLVICPANTGAFNVLARKSWQLLWYRSNNIPVYVVSQQREDLILTLNKNGLKFETTAVPFVGNGGTVDGLEYTYNKVVYVDCNSINSQRYGTEENPYLSISEALLYIDRDTAGLNNVIKVAAGTYDEIVNISDIQNRLVINTNKSSFVNSSDFDVFVKQFIINNCNYVKVVGLNLNNIGNALTDVCFEVNNTNYFEINTCCSETTQKYYLKAVDSKVLLKGKQFISNKTTCFIAYGLDGFSIESTFVLSNIGTIFLTHGSGVYASGGATQSLIDNAENYTQIGHVETDVMNLYSKNQGTTANRPQKIGKIGQTYFDTTLKKPIWWNGTNWIDATGASV